MWRAALALCLCLVLGGCSDAPPARTCDEVAVVTGPASICVGATQRSFLLQVPERPDGDLYVVLHGGGGWAQRTAQQTQMHELAPNSIVVYPEGTGIGGGFFRTWNAVHCCGLALRDDVDDVGFLEALVRAIEDEVGPQRVLVAGHSNGAMMAYRFAVERPDAVDAIAAVAGTIGGRATPSGPDLRLPMAATPVPVLIIHGLYDEQVAYAGGAGNSTVGGRLDLSVAEAVAFWRQANNATGPGTVVSPAPQTVVYPGDAEVRFITTQGGHPWPRGGADGVEPDASATIVAWFDSLSAGG